MSTVKGYAFALPFSWAAASQAWPETCSTCTLCEPSNSRRISVQDFGLEVRVCAQAVHFSLPGNSCACTEAVGCTGPRPLCLLVARPGLGIIMQGGLLRWPTLGPKPWSWPWLWPWSCRGCCWPPTRLLSCMRLRLQTALAFASPAFSTLQRAAISVTLHPVQACPASSSCCASRVRLLRWRSASFLRSARSSSEACQPRMCLLHVFPPMYGLRIPVFSSFLQVLPFGLPVPICVCPPASFGLAKRKGLPCTPSGEGASRRLAALASSSCSRFALACEQRRACLPNCFLVSGMPSLQPWPRELQLSPSAQDAPLGPWPALQPPAPQPGALHSGRLYPMPCLSEVVPVERVFLIHEPTDG